MYSHKRRQWTDGHATIPPTHIALMGMERLVPTLGDLALMLSLSRRLLCYSAKMNRLYAAYKFTSPLRRNRLGANTSPRYHRQWAFVLQNSPLEGLAQMYVVAPASMHVLFFVS